MKYAMLSLAALVVPCLGNPAPYWRPYFTRPVRPADSGTIVVLNDMQFNVQVIEEPQGGIYNAPPGGPPVYIPGSFSADVKLNGQVEVSYVSGNQGTFNYVINPIDGGGFPGCVRVSPNGCGATTWCPGNPSSPPVTCPQGTELPVTLQPFHSPL
ncbi:hypothetical protein N7471_002215 [Penicillium samsonianum]|uniref:uncharacterized protein n=1 Tax=Penicillium samsonianum TaxID=1882272 RepID=UPI00254810D5|nr:uncharacterized protein N7471_002215 [Penicillium samsonianum]KAJ6142762.1 hypothetical protein N7471_002215 [Penicillium samsonianum]